MYKNYDFPTGEMLQERFAYMFNKPSIGFGLPWLDANPGRGVHRNRSSAG